MTRRSVDIFNQPVPHIYPQAYLQIAAERGVAVSDVLQRAAIAGDFNTTSGKELSFTEFEALILAVLELAGDQGIGLEVGWRLPPTAYGNFGYALLCCPNLQEVLSLCQRFWHINARGVNMNADIQGDICVVNLTVPDIIREPFRHQILETTIASVMKGFQLLLRDSTAQTDIWFDYEAPAYADAAFQLLGNVHYGMPASQFRIAENLLTRPLDMSNPLGLGFALEQCEKEFQLTQLKSDPVLERVRQEMVFEQEGYPALDDIADRLNLSSRTLRRRLQHHGTRYKTLLEEARRRDAIKLLDDRNLSIQKIAGLLGYQDPANFTRAFRHWTGHTPSQYRQMRNNECPQSSSGPLRH
ncbi:helix-turn-helix domain-containing protein [Hahella ganghwensis]|uniref:helix-turn-helix domain-containing protein n=1 Tax=Hahella ganghwensis TaxID=286420 RepID=UPI000373277E|nr:AraC family transcriptional regulator [Hahella ganghwensis]